MQPLSKIIKVSFLALLACLSGMPIFAQSIGINEDGSAPDAHAILDVRSFTKGVLIPRISTAARLAITPTRGLLVYDSSLDQLFYHTGTEWAPLIFAGSPTGAWSLMGNANADTTSFLGTLNQAPLVVVAGGTMSGLISTSLPNTTWGYNSLAGPVKSRLGANTLLGSFTMATDTSGWQNTAVGSYALNASRGSNSNTALGYLSLGAITTGVDNTAVGALSLSLNTTGSLNTAAGYRALGANTTGSQNTAAGYLALGANTTSSNNTATGYMALASYTGSFIPSQTGSTAIGYAALQNTVFGYNNTANGIRALFANFTGFSNTAIGESAMDSSVAAFQNTALGENALEFNFAGQGNTACGTGALRDAKENFNTAIGQFSMSTLSTGSAGNTSIGDNISVPLPPMNNVTLIGKEALETTRSTDLVRFGNSAVTVIEGQVPWSRPSDGRFKFNIEEDNRGLDFILRLRPVTYQLDVRKLEQFSGNKTTASIDSAYTAATALRRTGFIAQEVEKAARDAGYSFEGVEKPVNDKDHYRLSYESFVMPLVKSVQELNKKLDRLKEETKEMEKKAENL